MVLISIILAKEAVTEDNHHSLGHNLGAGVIIIDDNISLLHIRDIYNYRNGNHSQAPLICPTADPTALKATAHAGNTTVRVNISISLGKFEV